MSLNYQDYYSLIGATQHSEFESKLKELLFNPKERKAFYDGLLEINHDLSIDLFKPYFEIYAAERKTNQQDYTPDSVARLLAVLTRSDKETLETSKYAGWDPTAGTGSLLIQKWNDDRIQETPWSYAPHRYTYRADELADNAIPYLIHNLAIRGMNAIVVHGNALEGTVKQVYLIQNSNDDFMAYSDINVMPHTDDCAKEFGVKKWLEKEIDYKESGKVTWYPALPMKRKALEIQKGTPGEYVKQEDTLQVGDIAEIERAKAKKVYPRGTIIVQMSATRGQIGLLESDGEVQSHYACIIYDGSFEPGFLFEMLKKNSPRHFHRVQEGLNLKLQDIQTIPISLPMQKISLKELIDMQDSGEQMSLF